MSAAAYNRRQLELGALTDEILVELVRRYQQDHGLVVDGKAGPATLAHLEAPREAAAAATPSSGVLGWLARAAAVLRGPPERGLWIDEQGWLHGERVVRREAHPSWFYARLVTGRPVGIVNHYTATPFGTAEAMANRRTRPRPPELSNSWHLTVGADGRIWQQASLLCGCWHVAGGQLVVDGRTLQVNRSCVGIEHEGDGTEWPEPMVRATIALHLVIIPWADIPPVRASLRHSDLARAAIAAGRIPAARGRRDPGPLWERDIEPRILAAAFG